MNARGAIREILIMALSMGPQDTPLTHDIYYSGVYAITQTSPALYPQQQPVMVEPSVVSRDACHHATRRVR